MFFTVNKTTSGIKVYNESNFSALNIRERDDIENWVLERPEILGEKLYVLTNEFDKFDKTNERLDILALDKKGNLVIVELKRDDSGKSVELQAIKYAAYCSTLTIEEVINIHKEFLLNKGKQLSEEEILSKLEEFVDSELDLVSDRPRIILASREFRPEVTSTVLWLRKFGIDISCVKFSVYNLNDTEIAITTSVLIPVPETEEYVIRVEKKEINEKEISDRNKTLNKFLESLQTMSIDKLNIDSSLTYLNYKANYLQLKTEQPGVHFEFCFRGRRNALEVGIHFEKHNDDRNKQLVEELQKSFESELETKLNEESLKFQPEWIAKGKWARIYILNSSGVIDENLKNWALEKMKILYNTLKDEIKY